MVKRALLIGINYVGTPFQLNGCINDVKNMELMLRRYGYTEFITLTDETPIKPTYMAIINAINDLLKDIKRGDSLVFHYSGHGALLKDTNGDELTGYDSSIVPLDYAQRGVIVDDQLRQILCDKVPPAVNLFGLMDCCHSGSSFDLRYLYTDYTRPIRAIKRGAAYNTNEWSLRQMITDNKKCSLTQGNVVMMSGCMDSQEAADAYMNGKYGGALTNCFIETLGATAKPKWKVLLKDVKCRLLLKGFPQNPQLSCGQNVLTENLLFI
jgi:hypothetical protein